MLLPVCRPNEALLEYHSLQLAKPGHLTFRCPQRNPTSGLDFTFVLPKRLRHEDILQGNTEGAQKHPDLAAYSKEKITARNDTDASHLAAHDNVDHIFMVFVTCPKEVTKQRLADMVPAQKAAMLLYLYMSRELPTHQ